MKTLSLSLLAASVIVLSVSGLRAQSFPLEPGVYLYSEYGYGGEVIVVRPGERLDDFNHVRFPSGRNANNRISSIRIVGEMEVTLFDYREFEGESVRLNRSTPHLSRIPLGFDEDWNNELSSLVVRPEESVRRKRWSWGWGRSRSDRNGIDYDDPPRRRTRVEDDYIYRQHRDSRTGRVVRRAYQDVLDREPDSEGLYRYVEIMERRGWSETRLRQELRKSREFRTVTIPREVTAAYREVLGREPDQAGLRYYSGRMQNSDWTASRVRDALKQSPEYRSTQGSNRQRPATKSRPDSANPPRTPSSKGTGR